MTAETEVRCQLSEISSKVAIEEEKSGLDMNSSYEDRPKVGGDINGGDKPAVVDDDDKDEEEAEAESGAGGYTNLVNGGGKDDPDGSYVFVSRSDSANGDLIDRDLKSAECVHESHVSKEVGSLNEGQAGELSNGNGETLSVDCNSVAEEGTDVALNGGSLGEPVVAGDDDVVVQSEIEAAVVESECAGLNGCDARLEERVEPVSASDLVENQEFPIVVSEVNHYCGTPPPLDDGKIESEEQVNSNSTLESGEVPEPEILVSEVGELHDGEKKSDKENTDLRVSAEVHVESSEPSECKSSSGLDDGKLNSGEHPKIESPTEVEGNPGSEVTVSEAAECKSPEVEVQLDDSKIESEEQTDLLTTAESGEVRESEMLVSEVGELHDGEEKSDIENTDLRVSEEAHIENSEPSKCKSSGLDDGKLNSEEHAKLELPTEVEGSPESEVMVSEAADCKLPEVEVQLDDGKIESEEQTDLNSTAESGEVRESEMLVLEVGDLRDGEQKPQEQDTVENLPFRESQEAQILYPETSECKSSVLDENSEEQANIEVSMEIECSQESLVMVSEAAEFKLPEVKVTEVVAEMQTELESPREVTESLESQTTKPESVELDSHQQLDDGEEKRDEEEKTDLRLDPKENQESLLVVTDNGTEEDDGTEEIDKVAILAKETVPGETQITDDSCTTSHVDGSVTGAQVHNELIDGSQNTTDLNGSADTRSMPSPPDCKRPELQIEGEPVESIRCCPPEDAKLEMEVKNDSVGGDITTSSNELSSGIEVDPSINPEGKVSTLSCGKVDIESEVSSRVADCVVDGLDPKYHASDSLENGSGADIKSESQVEDCPPLSLSDMPCSDGGVSRSAVLDNSVVTSGSAPNHVLEALNVQEDGDQVGGGNGDDSEDLKREKVDIEQVDKNEILTPSLERSGAGALNEQSASVEVLSRPFHFLVKIPRYDDEKLREQIRHAQLQVIEKTQLRDAIRVNTQMTSANCQQLYNRREAAKSEARSARGLVKLKRQEIDSVQSVINRVKNAISVEDIDVRISNMEHMIQHETLPLKEEKQFIRDIKQLKHLREQLSSNMGSKDEVQEALDQRDRTEERLKQMQILKKELDFLKAKVSKAQETAVAAEKKWAAESKILNELKAQFRVADDTRQEAYAQLQNLKKQLYEKNSRFRMYKDDATAAYDYASTGNKEALHHLCVNQVEAVMDLWNKDDEFREEYLRCNTRSTLRRFRTSDGRALGPDEEPIALPNFEDERIDGSLSTGKANYELPITVEQEKQISNLAGEETDGKSVAKVAEQADEMTNKTKIGKPTLRSGSETVSGGGKPEEALEEEHRPTKEEQELARKEEELRKEEVAAKLKEQRRLEEMVKAKEAIERKRRNAEKAQIKAELRAQKEAEQKEKEREKKAKKKERKKAPDGSSEGDTVPTSESSLATTKEAEVEESPSTVTKRPQKQFHFTKQSKPKSIPPPLRNRGKRRMQQWIWIILTAVVVLALFLLGNIGFYSNLGHNIKMRNYGL